jgi:hypothetical protein
MGHTPDGKGLHFYSYCQYAVGIIAGWEEGDIADRLNG